MTILYIIHSEHQMQLVFGSHQEKNTHIMMDIKNNNKSLLVHLFIIICMILEIISVDYCAIEKEKCKDSIYLPHIGCNETEITFEVIIIFYKQRIFNYFFLKNAEIF